MKDSYVTWKCTGACQLEKTLEHSFQLNKSLQLSLLRLQGKTTVNFLLVGSNHLAGFTQPASKIVINLHYVICIAVFLTWHLSVSLLSMAILSKFNVVIF